MAFVKLDCGILNSTIWVDRDAREVFITALLMAEPKELESPQPQLEVKAIRETGWSVPPGWYGMVPAAGIGIVRRSGVDEERGIAALERLGSPEPDSRSQDFDGRRLVRVDGGYVVLNFDKYRQKDHSAAERSRRYRERKKASRVSSGSPRVASRSATQAEAQAEAQAYPEAEEAFGVGYRELGSPAKENPSLRGYLKASRNPGATAAVVRSFGPGGTDGRYSWEQVDRALTEMAAASVGFTSRALGGFLRKLHESPNGHEEPHQVFRRMAADARAELAKEAK